MVEPEKPFACNIPECGMTFTNEDHLHVHTKKHDMALQLGLEQKSAFVADQTPTPTRFIRNCEEVGLFQDLQSVNPFDEGFKRAMETKAGILSIEGVASSIDDLHTPQITYPLIDNADSALYSTTNNQRNITISRSSSDESGAIKEYETTTISKLTNEVTTISRIVGKPDINDKYNAKTEETHNRDVVNETVSYTNNVIKIHSNVEIRKDGSLINVDSVIKDAKNIVTKDVLFNESNITVPQSKIPPIMSQKSIDFVLDSFVDSTNEITVEKNKSNQLKKVLKRNYSNAMNNNENDISNEEIASKNNGKEETSKEIHVDKDHEVIMKLGDGKKIRINLVDDATDKDDKTKIQDETKERLKDVLNKKAESKVKETRLIPNIITLPTGTLIPVALVNQSPIILHKYANMNSVQKVPITPFCLEKDRKEMKRKRENVSKKSVKSQSVLKKGKSDVVDLTSEETRDEKSVNKGRHKGTSFDILESRSAASKRYRERLKQKTAKQREETKQLKDMNKALVNENVFLKQLVTEHLRNCPNAEELRSKFKNNNYHKPVS